MYLKLIYLNDITASKPLQGGGGEDGGNTYVARQGEGIGPSRNEGILH